MKVLITGVSGFIGTHLSKTLLNNGFEVVGVDNFNDYYDIELKENRLKLLNQYENFTMIRTDIKKKDNVNYVFET